MLVSLIICLALLLPVNANDYCEQKCNQGKHTMCMYSPRISKTCAKITQQGLTLEQKKSVLKRHNEIRQELATGKTLTAAGVLPEAADMNELIWDPELERIAQRWIIQCLQGHDKCRDVERFKVGQNVAWRMPYKPGLEVTLVDDWYSEKNDFNDVSEIDSLKLNSPKPIGHFTALIASKTRYLGCGYLLFANKRAHIVCNYGPRGNIIDLPIYNKGNPCSACPTGYFCSKEYKGLCRDNNESDFSSSSRLQKFSLLGLTVLVTVLYSFIQ